MSAEIPEVGDEFDDLTSPGYFWRVDALVGEHVELNLYAYDDARRTDSFLRWPINRWPALFHRGLLGAARNAG